jgi:hypothetical protein
MRENRNAYRILTEKPGGKRPQGRLLYKWKKNVKMDFKEIEWGGFDWIDLV